MSKCEFCHSKSLVAEILTKQLWSVLGSNFPVCGVCSPLAAKLALKYSDKEELKAQVRAALRPETHNKKILLLSEGKFVDIDGNAASFQAVQGNAIGFQGNLRDGERVFSFVCNEKKENARVVAEQKRKLIIVEKLKTLLEELARLREDDGIREPLERE